MALELARDGGRLGGDVSLTGGVVLDETSDEDTKERDSGYDE